MPRRPEIELTVACALPPAHPHLRARVRSALSAPLDWKLLRKLAVYHRVRPLLYKRLAEHAADLAPEDVMVELKNEFRETSLRNLHLMGELIALTKAFGNARIPVLPHKGPLLAQMAYGDLTLREFSDLDLLVHSTDLARAISLMAEQGYRTAADLAWLTPSALLRWTGEVSFTSASGTNVDLHWRLTPNHYTVQLDPKVLWNSQTSISICGIEMPSLAPEALLLLLAVHGAKHCWEALGWLADIAWLLEATPDFDWQRATGLADASQCRRPLLLAAGLVKQLFEAPVPDLALDSSVEQLQQTVLDRLYNGPCESPQSPELFRFAATLSPDRIATFKHLCGLVFWPTDMDWKARRMPEALFPLYAPRRVARLVGKHALSLADRKHQPDADRKPDS